MKVCLGVTDLTLKLPEVHKQPVRNVEVSPSLCIPDNRLTAFKNMIEALGDLIEDGDIEEACTNIEAILKKCDGLPNPPDFLGGVALEDLAGMIESLQTSLGCQ